MIDSPLVRSAGRDVLSLALMDARNHSLHLFAQFQHFMNDGRAQTVTEFDGIETKL